MFFTNEVLPEWTEFALVLGYPTLMALLSQLSSSENDDEVWLSY